MNENELIARAYALLAEGHVEAAEGCFGRYMAARARVLPSGPLREAWQRDVDGRRAQLAAQERAGRERVEREGGRLSRLLSRRRRPRRRPQSARGRAYHLSSAGKRKISPPDDTAAPVCYKVRRPQRGGVAGRRGTGRRVNRRAEAGGGLPPRHRVKPPPLSKQALDSNSEGATPGLRFRDSPMPTTKGHVLYCEDHEDTRVLITMMLEHAGFRVTAAGRGAECLKLAEGGDRFDLYLLDHTFPDASGVTVCEGLRKFDAGTPILFYSARAMPQEREAAMKAGANDYLIKPLDLFTLAGHVAKWVEKNRGEIQKGKANRT